MPVPGLIAVSSRDGTHTYVAPVAAHRALTDETHRLALVHPEYDGFLTLEITARTDLGQVRIVPDHTLAGCITAQHALGSLGRGQVRPVDLELHPGAIPELGVSGWIHLCDDEGDDLAPPMRLSLATDPSLDCVLAGAKDGPWDDPSELDTVVDELLAGRPARRLARRIETMLEGNEDPGWSRRRLWGRQ